MSWFSDNYEKASLGAAALIAVGLGFVALKGGEDPYATPSVKRNDDASVPGLAKIEAVKKSLAEPHTVEPGDDSGRKLNLFTGVPLFSRIGDAKNPVDLLKSPPVHPGIENTWWLKYGLDPGYSDSPDRDPDKDGFTNREEHAGGTDPTDFGNNPDPIAKLLLKAMKTTQVHLKAQDFGGNQYMFRLENRIEQRLNMMNQANPKPIGAGVIIPFQNALMQNRFKFLRVDRRVRPGDALRQEVKVFIYEDQKPNKKGTIYEFDGRGNLWPLKRRTRGIMDSTAEFVLDALGQAGSPFKVEEGTRFSLPFNAQAKQKPYLLKKVDLDNKRVEIEYPGKDGKLETKQLPFPK